jgi:DNA repair photolyase
MSPVKIEHEFHPGTAKARNITKGTKEWADYNVNCISGCYNDCRYCYARVMAKRFHRCASGTWKDMRIRENVTRLDFRKRAGRVMFPSTHDLFEFTPFKEACFTVLGNLLTSTNDVLITTKPRLAVVQEIVEKFKVYKNSIQFRFTITSKDDSVLGFWEPNAPNYRERVSSLMWAFTKGFRTSVSVEPFLDYDPTDLIQEINPFVTESIWVGKMNYISKQGLSVGEQQYYDRVRENYSSGHLLEICCKLEKNPKIRIKDSIRNQLSNWEQLGMKKSTIRPVC